MMNQRMLRLLLLSLVPAMVLGWGQGSTGQVSEFDAQLERAKQQALAAFEQASKAAGDGEHLMRVPGMLADRRARRITIFGSALAPTEGTPIEFYITPERSGKDHEALATVYVRPSDVRRALEFIGMKPGRPIDWDQLHFWPKGERVTMHFAWPEPPKPGENGQPVNRRVNAEQLLFDLNTNKPFEPMGLVFTGSRWVENTEGERVLLADIANSRSIASTYNDPATVLDVVRQAGQSEVYESIVPNTAFRFTRDQVVEITIEPERREGPARVIELQLNAGVAENAAGAPGFHLVESGTNRSVVGPRAGLPALIQALGQMTERGHDPFVTVRPDKNLTLSQVRGLYQVLDQMQGITGIRLERSPEGEPFFRAFLPQDEMRDRERAIFPGPELHLTQTNGRITGRFIEVDKRWEVTPPTIHTREHEVVDGAAAAKLLADLNIPPRRHFLVMAPETMTYSQLLSWIAPMIRSHPVVFIFAEPVQAPRRAPANPEPRQP